MQVTRILHAAVNVSGELEATERFYSEVLGLTPATRPEIPGVDGRWFTVGSGQVHLVDAPFAGSGIDPTGPHYCLAVTDLDGAQVELGERGVPFLRAVQPGIPPEGGSSSGASDVVQIWFVDPAGHTIELQQDRPL
jgi:catechol 2,3-dioxygenase-like lactoylglutathione lyase family enzyme